jgi:hypothetical protein
MLRVTGLSTGEDRRERGVAEDALEDQVHEIKTANKVEESGGKSDPQTAFHGQAGHLGPTIQGNGQWERWEPRCDRRT